MNMYVIDTVVYGLSWKLVTQITNVIKRYVAAQRPTEKQYKDPIKGHIFLPPFYIRPID